MDADEWEAADAAIQTVLEAVGGAVAFLEAALHDLDQTVANLGELEDQGLLWNFSETWPAQLEYRVVAVSSAVRMHEEQVHATINRRAGKASPLHREADETFHRMYDDSQGYRIVYYLRNAALHGSRRLFEPRATSWVNSPSTVRLNLRREEVDGWWKKPLRDEIKGFPENPDMIPMCAEAVVTIRAERRALDRLTLPGLPAAVELVRAYMNEVSPNGGQVPRFMAIRRDGGGGPVPNLVMTPGVARYVDGWV